MEKYGKRGNVAVEFSGSAWASTSWSLQKHAKQRHLLVGRGILSRKGWSSRWQLSQRSFTKRANAHSYHPSNKHTSVKSTRQGQNFYNPRIFVLAPQRRGVLVKPQIKEEEKARRQDRTCGTNQFVLLQVESLQFATSFRQRHHSVICDTVALTQVDVLQLATVLSKLKAKGRKYHACVRLNSQQIIASLCILICISHSESVTFHSYWKTVWGVILNSYIPSSVLHQSVCPGCRHVL